MQKIKSCEKDRVMNNNFSELTMWMSLLVVSRFRDCINVICSWLCRCHSPLNKAQEQKNYRTLSNDYFVFISKRTLYTSIYAGLKRASSGQHSQLRSVFLFSPSTRSFFPRTFLTLAKKFLVLHDKTTALWRGNMSPERCSIFKFLNNRDELWDTWKKNC